MTTVLKPSRSLPFFFAVILSIGLTAVGGCSRSAPKERSSSEVLQEKSDQRKWRRESLEGAYDQVGHKNPKWDEPARQAMGLLAGMDPEDRTEEENDYHRIVHLAETAVEAGCDDPMIVYMNISMGGPATKDTNAAVQIYMKMAGDLSASGYSEIRKFYGCQQAAIGIKARDWKNRSGEIGNLELEARSHLLVALSEKGMPPVEARRACVSMLADVKSWKDQFEPTYEALAKALAKNFADTTAPDAVKGAFYIDYAWKARGNGYANTVTPEGWKLFGERLTTAEAALTQGWRKDPGDPFMPTKMMTVMFGESKSPEEAELWFGRAMKANTNNWAACSARLTYLEPKWGGSPEAVLDFGRQCATNEAWGWDVKLIIVEAHWRLSGYEQSRKDYWKRPEVWPEIHAAYAEYFRANPDSVYRRNYAWYAYQCEDWAVLNEQMPYLGEDDYAYFGGKESFDAMAREAKAHGKG